MPDDAAWVDIAPDWVCEVLSPTSEEFDRGDRLAMYLRGRVRHVWLLDPVAALLEVYRHGGETWSHVANHQGSADVRVEPFDAITLELSRLW